MEIDLEFLTIFSQFKLNDTKLFHWKNYQLFYKVFFLLFRKSFLFVSNSSWLRMENFIVDIHSHIYSDNQRTTGKNKKKLSISSNLKSCIERFYTFRVLKKDASRFLDTHFMESSDSVFLSRNSTKNKDKEKGNTLGK